MEEKERQERSELFAWLRGGDMSSDPEMEEKFIEMIADAVIAKTGIRRRARLNTSPLSIKALLQRAGMEDVAVPQIAESTPVPPKVAEVHVSSGKEKEETAPGWEIDSVMVAKTLSYMAYLEGWKLSMSYIQIIMYIAYGVWLARKHQRLFDEHPQVWQFGPVFPRVYNKFKRGFDDSSEVYAMMQRDYPRQFCFLTNCYKRFGLEQTARLKAVHTADGTPWMSTKKMNPDKLGVRIDDDLIEQWFEKRI